jgi:serine/threonine protein kinase
MTDIALILPTIQESEFILKHRKAHGSFGTVYKSKYGNETVAIKVVKKKKDFLKETRILDQIKANESIENIISTIGICPDQSVIISKWYPYTLEEQCATAIQNGDYQSIIKYLHNIACGLNKLREIGIVHDDIKMDNIMVDENNRAIIIDFGCSSIIDPDTSTLKKKINVMGTPIYSSPEKLSGKEYGFSSDIYAFGLLIWHIFAGIEPFPTYTKLKDFKNAIIEQKERPNQLEINYGPLQYLAIQCWNHDPDERPSPCYIINKLNELIY